MDMGAGAAAGASDQCDGLTSFHPVSLFFQEFRNMGVSRRIAVAMIDQRSFYQKTPPSGKFNNTISSGYNRVPLGAPMS